MSIFTFRFFLAIHAACDEGMAFASQDNCWPRQLYFNCTNWNHLTWLIWSAIGESSYQEWANNMRKDDYNWKPTCDQLREAFPWEFVESKILEQAKLAYDACASAGIRPEFGCH